MSNDADMSASTLLMSTNASNYTQKSTARTATTTSKTNRRHRKGAVYVNFGFILVIFFLFLHSFDPLQTSIQGDVLHQHLNHNTPIMNGLDQFTVTVATKKQNTDESNITRRWNLKNNQQQDDRIISLLNNAGIANELSDSQRARIPRWEQVIDLFGDEVVIVGKEDCERYRNAVPLAHRQLGVAGMFNTGTNLLETQLNKNIQLPQESLWQVPWGKHRMAEVKYNHTAAGMEQHKKENVLPIVMIRDPFAWLQSMCASPYAAEWRHGTHHCPNLIPNELDHATFKQLNPSFEVTVIFDKQSKRHFSSLVHLWSEWYGQYLHVDYPILMIRYEDLVFQPEVVLREIANCVDGTVRQPIQYQLKSSKAHGSGTDYIKALDKTADANARSKNMTIQDLEYTSKYLDRRLMNSFHYHIPKLLSFTA